MNDFLNDTAAEIINNYEKNFRSWCYILPNKRSTLYFRNALASNSGKTGKAPKMTDISSFIKELTNLNEPDELTLLFELFKVFNSISDQFNDFDAFYKLGEIILSDFNEIDAWLVNPDQIYKNIENLEEIDDRFDWLNLEQKIIIKKFWLNFSPNSKSNEKEIFIKIRESLPPVYKLFKKILLDKRIAYRGMIYKELADKIDALDFIDHRYDKYVFIGFNALNNAELKLFKYFKNNKKGMFYWNYDPYFHLDKLNEAGFFLRKNFSELDINLNIKDSVFNSEKRIEIIGAPKNTGQAKIISKQIHNLLSENILKNSALVLADENILFPVLNALPKSIHNLNITMGIPLKSTPVNQIIRLISELHLSKSFSDRHTGKKIVSDILKHPYIKNYDINAYNEVFQFKNGQFNNGFNTEILLSKNPLYKLIFEKNPDNETPLCFLNKLLEILYLIFDKSTDDKPIESLKNEFIYTAYKKINKLRELIEIHNIPFSLKTCIRFLNHVLNSLTIPFEGNIDDNLQVIGIMETRNLAFKNIIVAGLNEGIFPKSSQKPSFISQSLRVAYNLPIYKYQDAIFAYIFYALIQHADNIKIIYNNSPNEKNSGEISRFLLQLIHESNLNIKISSANESFKIPDNQKIIISKSIDVVNKLKRYYQTDENIKKRISPAALNTYLDCPLKFYFSYVCDIKGYSIDDDDFSALHTGNLLHDTMKELYKPFLNETVNTHDIQKMLSNPEVSIEKSIRSQFHIKKNEPLSGNQILLKTVINEYVKLILKNDFKYAPFKVLYLETDIFTGSVKCNLNNKQENFALYGTIDRIDLKDNLIRIIDYKTGKEQISNNDLKSLFEMNNNKRQKNIFQILFYTYLFKRFNGNGEYDVKPALFYLKSMNDFSFDESVKINTTDKETLIVDPHNLDILLTEFEENLKLLLTEIFSSKTDFVQTENLEICIYCNYNKICNRY